MPYSGVFLCDFMKGGRREWLAVEPGCFLAQGPDGFCAGCCLALRKTSGVVVQGFGRVGFRRVFYACLSAGKGGMAVGWRWWQRPAVGGFKSPRRCTGSA